MGQELRRLEELKASVAEVQKLVSGATPVTTEFDPTVAKRLTVIDQRLASIDQQAAKQAVISERILNKLRGWDQQIATIAKPEA